MKNWQKIAAIISLVLLLSVGLIFTVFNTGDHSSDRINILLLGTDARLPQQRGFTDSMSILSIDKQNKEIYILSIPRDSRVPIPGMGVDKINHAHAYGDMDTTIETVENFLEVRIDYYILVDFREFKEMVDTVGGITLDVEPHVADAVPELNGKAGVSRLNGKEALAYVRFRFDEAGDTGRVRRHQAAIKAIIDEALKPSNIWKAPVLFEQIRRNVRTDIPPLEPTVIEQLIMGFDLENAEIMALTGEYRYIDRINYFIPDLESAEEMVLELGLRD